MGLRDVGLLQIGFIIFVVKLLSLLLLFTVTFDSLLLLILFLIPLLLLIFLTLLLFNNKLLFLMEFSFDNFNFEIKLSSG